MGNAISKKRAQAGSNPKPNPGKVKSFWHFGRVDKLKAAGPKQDEQRKLTVHYTASQHYQENVFIEGSRPQYLEDLHTEAREGLKILQQEEHNNGVDFADDQTVGTSTPQLGRDASSKDRDGSVESGSTAVSSASTVSARPVLTRQGSTFKPLNPVKRLDKTRKRGRRTTIMGIPQQVQRELGMEKGALIRQLPNGEGVSPGVVVIPTIDGGITMMSHEGARVHLQDIEALQASREEQLLRHHIQAVYRDDLALNHKLGSRLSPMQRPKSLAVPGMTSSSFLQEPQGPVMSISPQATYLSKIIPNAILPAAVDVIEINRSCSRGSVRTVSKSSLVSASPASSRSGGGTHDGPSSTSSNWSHSQSSETIVSNSSTISSKGSGATPVANCIKEATDLNPEDQVSLKSTTSWVSSSSKGASQREPGSVSAGEVSDAGESVRNSCSFSRSLSVMKTKLPPVPPRRTNSLHHEKLKRRSRELVDINDINDLAVGGGHGGGDPSHAKEEEVVSSGSAGSPARSLVSSFLDDSRSSVNSSPLSPDQALPEDQSGSSNSSPQKVPSVGSKFERTMSPSSGYSSQSGTPTLSLKEICPPSPGKQKLKPPKSERSGSRISPAVSVSSSRTSLSSATSEPVHQETSVNSTPSQLPKASPPVAMAKNKVTPRPSAVTLFNIPPPPKVKAPSPPPPETWAHNKRTFELLCGPCPNTNKIHQLQKQQKEVPHMHRQETPTAHVTQPVASGTQTPVEEKTASQSENQESVLQEKKEPVPVQVHEQTTESVSEPLALRNTESSTIPKKEKESPEILQKEEASPVVQKQETKIPEDQKKEQESTAMPRKQPPPVMKKSSPLLHGNDPEKVQKIMQAQTILVKSKVKICTPLEDKISTSQTEEIDADTKAQGVTEYVTKEVSTPQQSSMQTLSVEAPKVNGISPPPSPPPAHHPPPPPSKKSPTSSVSTPPPEEEKEAPTMESSWPPPPPPMEEPPELVFEGQDEPDFPPPPPAFLQETLSEMVESCPVVFEVQEPTLAMEEHEASVLDGSVQQSVELPHATPSTLLEEAKPEEATLDDSVSTTPTVLEAEPDVSSEEPSHVQAQPCEQSSQVPEDSMEDTTAVAAELPSRSEVEPLQKEVEPLPEEVPPPTREAPPLPPPPPTTTTTTTVTSPEPSGSSTPAPPINVPHAPPLPIEGQSTVNFRRQPSLSTRENRSKELLSRNKSAPIPKEDANIPLVTPSLLQMVRLRSVNVGEEQTQAPSQGSKSGTESTPGQDQNSGQAVPQKPIRKSLSMKSPPPSMKSPPATVTAPSMRLQEAIRMKTAAMSSRDGLPARLSLRSSTSSTSSSELSALFPKSPEGGDLHKSPASTASFIFSRSTKKVVIETPTTPEAQANLKQNLAAELMQVSDQTKLVVANGTKKPVKVPPPVAKKPMQGTNPSDKPGTATTAKAENSESEAHIQSQKITEVNGETVQPAGQ